MKVATIVPTRHLPLIAGGDYYMALAHLVRDPEYAAFYRIQSALGNYVLLDNGVVETGTPMGIHELLETAESIKATEIILPDVIGDAETTLLQARECIPLAQSRGLKVLAVPQGRTPSEWAACLRELLSWYEVNTIGISRFSPVPRLEALWLVPELRASNKEIHLLGCGGDPEQEVRAIEWAFPGRIRGVDSGVASFYTKGWEVMLPGKPRPQVEVDFANDVLNEGLLRENIQIWRNRCLV